MGCRRYFGRCRTYCSFAIFFYFRRKLFRKMYIFKFMLNRRQITIVIKFVSIILRDYVENVFIVILAKMSLVDLSPWRIDVNVVYL